MLDGLETQLAPYLATFRLAEETVARVVQLYELASSCRRWPARRTAQGVRRDPRREHAGELTRRLGRDLAAIRSAVAALDQGQFLIGDDGDEHIQLRGRWPEAK
jgi:hypothetical protein